MKITDFEAWLLDVGHRIYRYLVYRRMFTPYEQEQKFIDDSEFTSNRYTFCRIEEAIDLGGGEWLLGLMLLDEDAEYAPLGIVNYYKLTEIRLVRFVGEEPYRIDEEEEEQ